MTSPLPASKQEPAKAGSFSVPKPRSMQSRFILMEGGTVLAALVLMGGALALSVLIRSQFSSDIEELHRQMALQARTHAAFDETLLRFWRSQGSNDAQLLAQYRQSLAELRSLTKQSIAAAATEQERQKAKKLSDLEDAVLVLTDRVAAKPPPGQKAGATDMNEIPARELAVRRAFSATAEEQFESLRQATHRVAVYTGVQRIALLALGLFPVIVMMWFRHAHHVHIWTPLERLHRMVLDVKRGNLDVRGAVPDTVELGSLTAAFLMMASELREMRGSLEEKVRQRALQLEAANKDLLRAAKLASLGQLVSGVAHEINNPLTSILGFSEIVMTDTQLSASAQGQVRTIRDQALRLKHLVANLSQLARRTPQQFHRLDLRSIPDRLLELRSYQLAANNIRVSYQRAERPIWVNGERDALLQLMLQLVLNSEHAIREVHETGEIKLLCGIAEGHALISIEDNGCGMDAEMREHIFDPFFTTRQSRQGTGLGLSICHGIVEQHEGEIRVESEAGRGATFVVRLPLLAKDGDSNTMARESALAGGNGEPATERSVSRNLASQRFLVIDDEAEILNLVSEVLSSVGAKVVTLQDSTKLDAILEQETFDGVFCDLKMPGRDGISVLRTLRRHHPILAKHFLLMTGNLADADKASAELDGVPILPKPFSIKQLREMLRQIASKSA